MYESANVERSCNFYSIDIFTSIYLRGRRLSVYFIYFTYIRLYIFTVAHISKSFVIREYISFEPPYGRTECAHWRPSVFPFAICTRPPRRLIETRQENHRRSRERSHPPRGRIESARTISRFENNYPADRFGSPSEFLLVARRQRKRRFERALEADPARTRRSCRQKRNKNQ